MPCSRSRTGGCQTNREHAYVVLSRPREQTQVYVSWEDLGEAGIDVGAIERLGERMRHSRAQEASVMRQLAANATERQQMIQREVDPVQEFDLGRGLD